MDGFDLARSTLDVIVEDRTTGRLYELRHTLHLPTDAEWLAYSRQAAAIQFTDGADGKVVTDDAAAAELALWARCIESVDDQYLWEGATVMARPDWKDKIPPTHKAVAIRRLLTIRAAVVHGPLA